MEVLLIITGIIVRYFTKYFVSFVPLIFQKKIASTDFKLPCAMLY